MAAVWMVGLGDEPTRSAEICIFEVFGDALEDDGRDGPRQAYAGPLAGPAGRAFGP